MSTQVVHFTALHCNSLSIGNSRHFTYFSREHQGNTLGCYLVVPFCDMINGLQCMLNGPCLSTQSQIDNIKPIYSNFNEGRMYLVNCKCGIYLPHTLIRQSVRTTVLILKFTTYMSVHFKSPSYSFFKVKKEPQECSKPQRKNSSLRIWSIFYPFMPQSCSSYHAIFDPIGNCNVIAYWQEKMKIKLNHTPRLYALYDFRPEHAV